MEEEKHRSEFQIQPRRAAWREWESAAVREGLSYEVLEMSSPPVLGNDRLTEDCRRWYRSGGRARSVHGAFIDVNPGSGDEAFRSLSRRRCRESCTLAAELGAENVVFHSSCAAFLRGAYMEHWADVCAEFYWQLAEETGLHIWIENSQDTDAVPIRELMKRVSHPLVGVCLDLGHAHYSRMTAEQWFDCLGDRIGYLHLSDNRGSWDEHLPLGEGSVDWESANALWRAANRKMPVTIEIGSVEGLERSLAFLRKHGYFGME